MNILVFSRSFFPQVGGIEKHVLEVSKRLIRKGYKVTVLCELDSNFTDKENCFGINIVRLKYFKLKYLGLLNVWFWIFKNRYLIKNADLIHIHDVFIWYLPFRFLYPKKKVYVTFHGWEGTYPIPKKNIFLKRISNFFANGSICVGKYIEKYYQIKADLITYGATNIPGKDFKKNKKHVIYLGRLEKDTGLPIILNLLKEYKDFKIDFCGDGTLSTECKKLGKVHGFTEPERYLRSARICFASGYLSILEAMAHKCITVLAYDNPLKRDYVNLSPFKKLVISGSSVAQLKRRIDNLISDSQKEKKIIENSYDFALKQSWLKLTNKYLRLWYNFLI